MALIFSEMHEIFKTNNNSTLWVFYMTLTACKQDIWKISQLFFLFNGYYGKKNSHSLLIPFATNWDAPMFFSILYVLLLYWWFVANSILQLNPSSNYDGFTLPCTVYMVVTVYMYVTLHNENFKSTLPDSNRNETNCYRHYSVE